MILTMLEQNYQFDNNENGIQQVIETINETMTKENRLFSHLVIDSQEIYEDYEAYISENLDEIKEIVVITKTMKEFIGSLLVSLNDYTKRAIPEIEKIINEFYQSPTEQNWYTLNQLLEGIEWIYQSIKSIDQVNHDVEKETWDELIKCRATFEVELPNLLEAMENKDTILIADIIQYEFLPQFQMINTETEKTFEVQ